MVGLLRFAVPAWGQVGFDNTQVHHMCKIINQLGWKRSLKPLSPTFNPLRVEGWMCCLWLQQELKKMVSPYLWGYLAECLWSGHNAHSAKRAQHVAVGPAVCRAQAEISCGDALLLGLWNWQVEGGWKKWRLLMTTSPPCSGGTVNHSVINTTPLIFQITFFQAAFPSKILFEWVPWPRDQGKNGIFFGQMLPSSGDFLWDLKFDLVLDVFFEVMWHHLR